MKFGDDGRLYAINPEAGFFGVAPGTGEDTNPNAVRTLDANSHLHQRRQDRRRRRVVGGPDRRAAGPPHRLEGQRLDARRPTRPAAHPNARFTAPAVAVPVDRPRVGGPEGRADLGDPLRRPPRHQRPARHRGLRLGARRVPRLDHELGDDRRRGRRRRRAPLRPLRHAAVLWLQHGRLLRSTGSRSARPTDADKLPEAVLGQLVPQGRRRQVPVARASARTAGCSSGSSSGSTATGDAVDTPIGRVPAAGRHRHRPASTSTTPRMAELRHGRRRGRGAPSSRRSRSTTPSSASALPDELRDELARAREAPRRRLSHRGPRLSGAALRGGTGRRAALSGWRRRTRPSASGPRRHRQAPAGPGPGRPPGRWP